MKQTTILQSLRRVGAGLALAVGVWAIGGCQPAYVAKPLTAELSGNTPDAQLSFWHTLADRPVTSNDEAFHGLLLFLDGEDPAKDYAERVRVLKSRKLIPADFDQASMQAVERGTMAVAICRILKIEGGLMMHMAGPTPRYAVRELVFAGIYPPSSPFQTFSGSEFLGIMGRIEDRQRQSTAKAAPTSTAGPTKPAIKK